MNILILCHKQSHLNDVYDIHGKIKLCIYCVKMCVKLSACNTPTETLQILQTSKYYKGACLNLERLVSWCFEPSQPQRITSGLNINFNQAPSYSFHKSLYHKSFLAYLYSVGIQHGNLPPAGWPILFCGPTQEPCVSHSQHRENQESFWKKCRCMDRKGRNEQGRNLQQ